MKQFNEVFYLVPKVISLVFVAFVFIWDRLYLFEGHHILTSVTFSLLILVLLISIIRGLARSLSKDCCPKHQ